MKKFLLSASRLLVAVSLVAFSWFAYGGSFSTDFNSGLPASSSVYGNAIVDTNGGVGDSGALKLTPAAANQSGSFIIDDLDPGFRVWSFLATFRVRLGNGTVPPADGFSFNFATDLPNSAFGEEGAGSGLTVVFDAYDNGTGDNPEGPELRIKYGGTLVASRKLSNQLKTSTNYVDVLIRYNSAGTLDVVLNNSLLFTNLFVFGQPPAGARFGFGARTGGNYEEHFIDDLTITTTTLNRFYIKGSVTPSPPMNVSPDSPVRVVLQEFGQTVDTNSIAMTFNGVPVRPDITKTGSVDTIYYDPPGGLIYSSQNKVAITFADSSGQPPVTLQYDFNVTQAPLWSLAPNSRTYLPPDTDTTSGNTPLYRSVGYNAYSNQLYVVSRTGATAGLTVNVLDASTGADLYQLNTSGISSGSIILLAIVAADDGSIYAANMTGNASTTALKIYRWLNSNSNTVPQQVFSGNPNVSTTSRWGDTLTVRGTDVNTWLLLDAGNDKCSAIIYPSDNELTNFIAFPMTHTYGGTTIGRGLQWAAADGVYYLKKKTAAPQPLMQLQYQSSGVTTIVLNSATYHAQVGPLGFDNTRPLAAGIFFTTNTVSPQPDRLIVYDVTDLNSPFQIAQYNFPVNHQKNANFIGQVIFGGDKIFAVDGNNGIICVPAVSLRSAQLAFRLSGANVQLSWTNTTPFVLQATGDLSNPAWTNLNAPITVASNINSVTDTLGAGNKFYRLIKP